MQNKHVFAALIGVGDYEEMSIANLSAYRMDLAMIGTALEAGLKVPSDHIRLVAGEDHNGYVTTNALAHTIADFRDLLGSEDVFIFYFSGHGRDRNLIFSNGQVELQSVVNYIEKLPARSKFVILDCCYSGNFQSSGARVMHFEDLMSDFEGKGVAVFASSSADEVSRLGPNGNHSMFTGALSSAINLNKKTKEGRISLTDIYDETMYLVNAWNRQNLGREQQPIFRSSIGGTIYFQVEEYHPYKRMEVKYDEEDYRLVRIKPLSTGTTKRLAAFVITERGEDELPALTKEIAERIKYAEVYENEKSELKFERTPARGVWVYFGHDESDIINSRHFAYTIWAVDDEMRNKFFREGTNGKVVDGIFVFENTSYEMIRRMQTSEKTREEFIESNRKMLALTVTMAEKFVYDLQEVFNGTVPFRDMRDRYADWINRVRRRYIALSDEDVAPDDLHEWSQSIMELAGWVLDLSIYLEKDPAENGLADNEKWLIKHAVSRYHESMEKIRKNEDEIDWEAP